MTLVHITPEYELNMYTKIEWSIRKECVFPPDLFKHYSGLILGELEVPIAFIFGNNRKIRK